MDKRKKKQGRKGKKGKERTFAAGITAVKEIFRRPLCYKKKRRGVCL